LQQRVHNREECLGFSEESEWRDFL
jgi:hypothetical protein